MNRWIAWISNSRRSILYIPSYVTEKKVTGFIKLTSQHSPTIDLLWTVTQYWPCNKPKAWQSPDMLLTVKRKIGVQGLQSLTPLNLLCHVRWCQHFTWHMVTLFQRAYCESLWNNDLNYGMFPYFQHSAEKHHTGSPRKWTRSAYFKFTTCQFVLQICCGLLWILTAMNSQLNILLQILVLQFAATDFKPIILSFAYYYNFFFLKWH